MCCRSFPRPPLLLLWLCLLPLLLSPCAAAAAEPPPPAETLRWWLYHLSVQLPPLNFSSNSSWIDIRFALSDLVCTNISLGPVASAQRGLSYAIDARGLGLSCRGRWAGSSNKLPSFNGTLAMALDKAELALNLTLATDAQGLAENATAIVSAKTPISLLDFEGAPEAIELILQIPGVNALLRAALGQVLQAELSAALTGLIDTNLTLALRQIDAVIAQYMRPSRVPVPPSVPPGASDLRNSSLVHVLNWLVDDVLGHPGTNFSLDALIDDLTNHTGRIDLAHLNATAWLNITDLADLGLTLKELAIGGLDSWGNLSLFDAISAYQLDTKTFLGRLGMNVSFAVTVKLTGPSIKGPTLIEAGDIRLRMSNATMDFLFQLAVNDTASCALEPTQMFNWNCLLSTVWDFNATRLQLNFTLQELMLFAGSGGEGEQDLDQAINLLLALFISNYSPAIPAALNGLLAGPVREYVNSAMDVEVHNATCPAPSPIKPHNRPETDMLAVYIASGSGVGLFLVFALYLRRNAQQAQKKGSVVEDDDGYTSEESMALLLNRATASAPCLAVEPTVPPFMRYIMPLAILSTMFLFIWSNTSHAAAVYPEVTLGREKIVFKDMFSFSLANSVRDMWKAGVYPLSILIGTFSGAWPYMKLVMMLFCWIAPVKWLTVSRRETFLQILDALGKWSMIDTIVMVMMMVAFRFHLPIPDQDHGHASDSSFDIFVRPEIGMTVFVFATISSLVLSHIILHVHRVALASHQPADPVTEAEALRRHGFVHGEEVYRFTFLGGALISLLILCTGAMIGLGAFWEAFSFNFKGLAGWAMDLDHINPIRNFSIVSLGRQIPAAAEFPNDFNVRILQVMFFVFAFVVPLLHMIVLLLVWNVPLAAKMQSYVFHATEVLNAWAALDVFVISIVAAVLEIGQFAQFIIGGMCDPINEILKQYFDKQLHGDDKCFDVSTTLRDGTWMLISGMLSSLCISLVVMRLCQIAVADRLRGGTRASSMLRMSSMRSIQQGPAKVAMGSCQRVLLNLACRLWLVEVEDLSSIA